jgi:anti-sigma factor RsiW
MTRPPSLEQLNAFVDGELGLAEQLEIERLMRDDAPLQARVESLRAVRQAVRSEADYHRAPESVRSRVQALVTRPDAPAAPRLPLLQRARQALQGWFAWRPLATSLGAAALAVVALHATLQPSGDDRISEEIIASHVRATLAQRLVDVPSSDHHTVKPWLSSRLDFSPPVRELNGNASALLGGRVDYVGGRPVAVLAYKRGAHLVDSYVWPTSAADASVQRSSQRGFQIAHWRRGGMAHWVVSDLSAQEFDVLVSELSAPDT